MNLKSIDLNLLVYLDVLLRKCSVTQAAETGANLLAASIKAIRARATVGEVS